MARPKTAERQGVDSEDQYLVRRLADLGADPDFVAETMAMKFAERALQLMEERGISRSQLASRMGVSRAYVTRIFDSPPNLTLRSIAAVSLALGAQPALYIEPAPGEARGRLVPHTRDLSGP
jgi:DNA-binding phage protein